MVIITYNRQIITGNIKAELQKFKAKKLVTTYCKQKSQGHYHHASKKGNIEYIGTPYEMNWQDYSDQKGFHIFDLDTRIKEFIENPFTIYSKIDYDDANSDITTSSYLDPEFLSELTGKYVKIKVINKTNPYMFDLFIDQVNNQNIIDISISEELIDIQINSDPRRGTSEEHPLNPARIDSAVELELARQKLTGDSIPALDQQVLIQINGNVAFDVTDLVHPDIASQVALAARVVGLDIAGIDLVARDISKPMAEQNAAIVEVNAGPSLLMHIKPASGKPQPVGKEVVNHLFPSAADIRIPLVGICGESGKTPVAEMVAHFLRLTNVYVGLSCSKGLFFGNRAIPNTNASNWENARRTLLNRAVEAAVIENNHLSMLIEGLAYDRCQVGVVLNVNPKANFPQYAIYDEDQVFSVVRTQIDVVLPTGVGVLNADDRMCVEMAELCDGEVIFFSENANSEVVKNHLQTGGRAVLVGKQQITLKSGKLDQKSIPVPRHSEASSSTPWKTMNLGAAIAAAWALDIPFNVIEAGAQTFVPDATTAIGA